MTNILCYETTGRPVFIIVLRRRRIPYLKNLVGQVAPQALPDLRKYPRTACIPFPCMNEMTIDSVLKKNKIERIPSIFNLQSSIVNVHVRAEYYTWSATLLFGCPSIGSKMWIVAPLYEGFGAPKISSTGLVAKWGHG